MNLPINPESLTPPRGFSHGVVSDGGRLLHIAGETGHLADGSIADEFVEQFAQACRNIATVVAAAGGAPTDLVSMTIYVLDVASYRDNLKRVGDAYQSVFGRHFPAIALVGVSELVDLDALVEITAVAVIPD